MSHSIYTISLSPNTQACQEYQKQETKSCQSSTLFLISLTQAEAVIASNLLKGMKLSSSRYIQSDLFSVPEGIKMVEQSLTCHLSRCTYHPCLNDPQLPVVSVGRGPSDSKLPLQQLAQQLPTKHSILSIFIFTLKLPQRGQQLYFYTHGILFLPSHYLIYRISRLL